MAYNKIDLHVTQYHYDVIIYYNIILTYIRSTNFFAMVFIVLM